MGEDLDNIIAVMILCRKVRHVDIDGRIFVEMGLKCRLNRLIIGVLRIGNFQVLKEFSAVARLVIIGIQHLCRHGFAKASRTTDTGQIPVCTDRTVDIGNKHGLVNVLVTSCFCETTVSPIDVDTHIPIAMQE